MPLYPYRCTQCGHRFEKIQSFSAEPETECPKCHGALERPLTAPSLQFKGAGWYVNDYASKSSAPASESAPESGKAAASDAGKASSAGDNKAAAASSENPAKTSAATPAAAPSAASSPASSSSSSGSGS